MEWSQNALCVIVIVAVGLVWLISASGGKK